MISILSIFGTRPEAIKMAPVIKELAKYTNEVRSVVCVTAQHRHMLDQVLGFFEVRPDIDLDLMEERQSPASVTARAMTALTEVLEQIKPDWVLVQGDTTTAMAAGLASFYQRVPVGHIEAGLRTRNRYSPFPEEMNRRLIGSLATRHFVPTQRAAAALRAEAVAEESILVTGNTVIDALLWTVAQGPSSGTKKVFSTLGITLDSKQNGFLSNLRMILVTAHRRENFGRPLENICRALNEIVAKNPDICIVYPVHMNPNVREPVYQSLSNRDRIYLIDPLPYESFAHLMKAAHLVLTDSGGIQEEAPALGKPVLVLRSETERPEAVEAGAVKIVGTEMQTIVQETQHLLSDGDRYQRMARAVSPYGDGRASQRIIAALLGRVQQ